MHSNQYGQVIRTSSEVIDLLYQNPELDLDKINLDSDSAVKQFNDSAKQCDYNITVHLAKNIHESLEEFDKANQKDWYVPEEYKNMDIEGYLVSVCPKQNYERLIEELVAFREKDMLNLLRWCKYFVDTCRKNDLTWGVGRGSSVASYVLFLIGVHKVDSIKYNLDFQEFMR